MDTMKQKIKDSMPDKMSKDRSTEILSRLDPWMIELYKILKESFQEREEKQIKLQKEK